MVIFNHTGVTGFQLYSTYEVGKLTYWGLVYMSVLCKIAVPLFFMISGALLLKRDLSLKDICVSKILRIFVVLIITSGVYYLYNSELIYLSFQ